MQEGVISMKKLISNYVSNKNGATAIEYSLIAAAIALAIVTVVFLLGEDVIAMFTEVSDVV